MCESVNVAASFAENLKSKAPIEKGQAPLAIWDACPFISASAVV
jgi:hypothetical protein